MPLPCGNLGSLFAVRIFLYYEEEKHLYACMKDGENEKQMCMRV